MPEIADQSRYQIRFEWGVSGVRRLAASDVVVIVDVLSASTEVVDAVAAGGAVPLAETGLAELAGTAHDAGAVVLLGALRNAAAVAAAVLAEQQRRGARTSVAVIAAGDADAAGWRVAVEDQFGAGAVIDALGALGLDHTSPEAAAACESFRGLQSAVRHLLTASASGQALLEAGSREAVLAAATLDAASAVPVLRDGVFVAA